MMVTFTVKVTLRPSQKAALGIAEIEQAFRNALSLMQPCKRSTMTPEQYEDFLKSLSTVAFPVQQESNPNIQWKVEDDMVERSALAKAFDFDGKQEIQTRAQKIPFWDLLVCCPKCGEWIYAEDLELDTNADALIHTGVVSDCVIPTDGLDVLCKDSREED